MYPIQKGGAGMEAAAAAVLAPEEAVEAYGPLVLRTAYTPW